MEKKQEKNHQESCESSNDLKDILNGSYKYFIIFYGQERKSMNGVDLDIDKFLIFPQRYSLTKGLSREDYLFYFSRFIFPVLNYLTKSLIFLRSQYRLDMCKAYVKRADRQDKWLHLNTEFHHCDKIVLFDTLNEIKNMEFFTDKPSKDIESSYMLDEYFKKKVKEEKNGIVDIEIIQNVCGDEIVKKVKIFTIIHNCYKIQERKFQNFVLLVSSCDKKRKMFKHMNFIKEKKWNSKMDRNFLELIDYHPFLYHTVFKGKILNQMDVTVINIHDFYDKEVVEIMREKKFFEHPNYLKHCFYIKDDEGDEYAVLENIESTLNDIIENIHRENVVAFDINIREVLDQLLTALKFSHKNGIVIGNMNTISIGIKSYGDGLFYKIFDFSKAFKAKLQTDFDYDIRNLGILLTELRGLFLTELYKYDTWTKIRNEDCLLTDLAYKMVTKGSSSNSYAGTFDEIESHPFMLNTEQTLNMFVKAAKLLESDKREKFLEILNKDYELVITSSWTSAINQNVMDELNRIYQGKTKFKSKSKKIPNGIINLVKTIRNLRVHERTEKIIKEIGPNDEDLLKFWTNYFPKLILHLYNSIKEIEK